MEGWNVALGTLQVSRGRNSRRSVKDLHLLKYYVYTNNARLTIEVESMTGLVIYIYIFTFVTERRQFGNLGVSFRRSLHLETGRTCDSATLCD